MASTGFGNGIATGDGSGKVNSSRGNGVQKSGFGDTQAVSVAQLRPKPADDTTGKMVPAEVIFKPTPTYTPEARNLRIEGEVVLEVVFEASGKLRIVRVVRGLGHGLDEAASHAAEQIRFKPAQRDGQPSDYTALVHIVFQLARSINVWSVNVWVGHSCPTPLLPVLLSLSRPLTFRLWDFMKDLGARWQRAGAKGYPASRQILPA